MPDDDQILRRDDQVFDYNRAVDLGNAVLINVVRTDDLRYGWGTRLLTGAKPGNHVENV